MHEWRYQCKCGTGQAGLAETPPNDIKCANCKKPVKVETKHKPEPKPRHWTEFQR